MANFQHGNNQQAISSRVSLRAEGILRDAPWATEPDPNDINLNEPAEIAAAYRLAEAWIGPKLEGK